jgi:hypothetical protein
MHLTATSSPVLYLTEQSYTSRFFRLTCRQPRGVFTKVLRPFLVYCHINGQRLHDYLDDGILGQSNRQTPLVRRAPTLPALRAGVWSQPHRLRMSPEQRFTFLGTSFDLTSARIYRAVDRIPLISSE